MEVRTVVPDEIGLGEVRLSDGRVAGLMRVPLDDGTGDVVDVVLSMALLGEFSAFADELRSRAAAGV